jgi:hypothetical protein
LTNDEFGATLDIDDGVENVSEYFRETYPESRLIFVEPQPQKHRPKQSGRKDGITTHKTSIEQSLGPRA